MRIVRPSLCATALAATLVATLAAAPEAGAGWRQDRALVERVGPIVRAFYVNWYCDVLDQARSRELIWHYSTVYPKAIRRMDDRELLITERKNALAAAIRMKRSGDCSSAGLPLLAEGLTQARNLAFGGFGKPYIKQRSDFEYVVFRYSDAFIALYVDKKCQVLDPKLRDTSTERFSRITEAFKSEFGFEAVQVTLDLMRKRRARLDDINCAANNRDRIGDLPILLNALERYIGIKALDDVTPMPPEPGGPLKM